MCKPALTQEEFRKNMENVSISQRIKTTLLSDNELFNLETRNKQLEYIDNKLNSEFGLKLNTKQFGYMFNVTPGTISTLQLRMKKEPKSVGRPSLLTENQEKLIHEFILNQTSNGDYVTKTDVLIFAQDKIGNEVTPTWIKSFFQRNSEQYFFVTLTPQEEERQTVPRAYLDQYINIIKCYIAGCDPELLFNLDECGSSNWENRKKLKFILPKEQKDCISHYSVSRRVSHTTMIACICAGGTRLTPMILSKQRSIEQIFYTGVRNGIDAIIYPKDTAYVNETSFKYYLENVLIPFISEQRKIPRLKDKKAILLMDNFGAHCTNEILNLLTTNNILAITFPPHTSNIFQMLDLTIFGAMKTRMKHVSCKFQFAKEVEHAYRLLRSFEEVTCSGAIRSSFRNAGFIYTRTENGYTLNFDEEKMRSKSVF